MDLFTYLNDLAHDIDTYLMAGLKEIIIMIWSFPIVRSIVFGSLFFSIVIFIIYQLLRSQGISRNRARGITDLIELFSNLFNK